MANLVDAAGDGGVAGTDYTLTGASTNFAAKRASVAKTQSAYGNSSGVAASDVFSLTQNLRFAYSGQDADSPVVAGRTAS